MPRIAHFPHYHIYREKAMQIHKPLIVTLACALCLLVRPARAGADAPNVSGVWEYKDPGAAANSITITLNADGTGKLDQEAIRYSIDGNTLNVVTGGDTVSYTFKIEGDTMTISGGDLERPTAFVRKGG